ncbi:single-stranded DNA-binding protein [Caminibacter pacificus]|uniref:Single-stranded DNA-binding protein n=1 Tax=Caminibacter pacificus TaxID=1424653 RepID=A0AAJ4RAP0_9BACT|nr:single-stranded DNA-binding protein [Caminibacter pacificus]QDD68211.1 single-stranded DNA-binding protein [Caminibacter pacificus]ROR38724.1 single-strand DNA-binding protein [Caminibacter pacificus]
MFNKVILIGNLTRDPELKYTPSGTAITKFGLATNRKYKDNLTGEEKQEVMFIDITLFGRSAEIANQYLKKGNKVLIEGRLILESWVDSTGQKRNKHSIVAEKVQFLSTKQENQNSQPQTSTQPITQSHQPQMQQDQPQSEQTTGQTKLPNIDIDEDEFPF